MSNSDSKTTKSFLSLTPSLTAPRTKGFMLLHFSSFLLLKSSYFSFLERMFRMLSLTSCLISALRAPTSQPPPQTLISPTNTQYPQVGDQGKEEKPRWNKDSCQKLFFLTLRNALSWPSKSGKESTIRFTQDLKSVSSTELKPEETLPKGFHSTNNGKHCCVRFQTSQSSQDLLGS